MYRKTIKIFPIRFFYFDGSTRVLQIVPQIRPITDLRNTTEISQLCHEKPEPIYNTKNGYGDMVIMSMETYESMMNTNQIDTAITEAEKEYKNL